MECPMATAMVYVKVSAKACVMAWATGYVSQSATVTAEGQMCPTNKFRPQPMQPSKYRLRPPPVLFHRLHC